MGNGTVTGRSSAVLQVVKQPAEETLLQRFDRYFEVVQANTPERLKQAHAIRYRVYCLETGFENASQNAGGLEKDTYDAHAIHGLLIHRNSRVAVGTVRLVLPLAEDPERSFAVQAVSDHPAVRNSTAFPIRTTAEISRFCISREFRRRASDTLYDQEGTEPTPANDPSERRSGPLMRLGLMQAIVRMSVAHGMTHWCAVMEPKLLRMLEAMAIRFTPLGSRVNYHGLRQPCMGNIKDVLNAVRKQRPAFWEVLTCGGALQY
jgi:N-acyl amino acid synthase of PEP-CTERM/exosortase system